MRNLATEVVVIGGGPVGLTAAIALASAGVETTLVAGKLRQGDNRTTALLAGSVTALDTLGIWERCRDNAAPLRVMRIVDSTSRLIRAPEVRFYATEIGLGSMIRRQDDKANAFGNRPIVESQGKSATNCLFK